jgi:hypothetical protein
MWSSNSARKTPRPRPLSLAPAAAGGPAGDAEVGQRPHRHPVELGQRARVGVERPRDDLALGADDGHPEVHAEPLVRQADVEERALQPVEAAIEVAEVEAAVLDRDVEALIERADAEHRQVELHLHGHADRAVQAVEEAELLLAQRRPGPGRRGLILDRDRRRRRGHPTLGLDPHAAQARGRRQQLGAVMAARDLQAVGQLDRIDLQQRRAGAAAQHELAQGAGLGPPGATPQAGRDALERAAGQAPRHGAGVAGERAVGEGRELEVQAVVGGRQGEPAGGDIGGDAQGHGACYPATPREASAGAVTVG